MGCVKIMCKYHYLCLNGGVWGKKKQKRKKNYYFKYSLYLTILKKK